MPGPGSYNLKDDFESRNRSPKKVFMSGRPKKEWMFMGIDMKIPPCGTYTVEEGFQRQSLSKYRNASSISIGKRHEMKYENPYKPGPGTY